MDVATTSVQLNSVEAWIFSGFLSAFARIAAHLQVYLLYPPNNPLKLFSGILTGGLTAVIYTDTLCTFLMVTGSLTVMGLGNFVLFVAEEG